MSLKSLNITLSASPPWLLQRVATLFKLYSLLPLTSLSEATLLSTLRKSRPSDETRFLSLLLYHRQTYLNFHAFWPHVSVGKLSLLHFRLILPTWLPAPLTLAYLPILEPWIYLIFYTLSLIFDNSLYLLILFSQNINMLNYLPTKNNSPSPSSTLLVAILFYWHYFTTKFLEEQTLLPCLPFTTPSIDLGLISSQLCWNCFKSHQQPPTSKFSKKFLSLPSLIL